MDINCIEVYIKKKFEKNVLVLFNFLYVLIFLKIFKNYLLIVVMMLNKFFLIYYL